MATSSALISVLESNSLIIMKILLHLVFVVMVFMIFVCCLLPFGHRMGTKLVCETWFNFCCKHRIMSKVQRLIDTEYICSI